MVLMKETSKVLLYLEVSIDMTEKFKKVIGSLGQQRENRESS